MIPYGQQDISKEDIDEVISVLESDFLTQGPKVPLFEDSLARTVDAKYAVAMNSATSALHAACIALGVEQGDNVWTSPISFVASANCAIYCGAAVDFVDINPRTYNICPDALEKKLIQAKGNASLPKVVIVVHLSGQPSSLKKIHELSQIYKFKIIEDASHALGAKYLDNYIGSCRFSDITVFSFHPVKIITTAEGGMAVTNQEQIFHKLSLLKTHGITRDNSLMIEPSHGPWYYEQVELGFNYRMSDLHAALGLSQIKRLHQFVAKRHSIAKVYNHELASLPITTPWQDPKHYSSFHLYIIRIDSLKLDHLKFFQGLIAANINVNLHYIPIYRHPFYQQFGYKVEHFPEAEEYYSQAISLPMFPTLRQNQQEHVVDTIKKLCISARINQY